MNWAGKLMEKQDYYTRIGEKHVYLELDDLVLAVLEKNKENEKKALSFVKQMFGKIIDEYDQIRLQGVYLRMLNDESFKELVQACKEVKK